jgi:CRISPR-associated protein (TIGR03985 family)
LSNLAFIYPPSPQILNWLACGQLANRLQRALRLWVLLHQFYSPQSYWRESLSESFTYSDLRERLFASTHPKSEQLSVDTLATTCYDPNCICHKRFYEWIVAWENQLSSQWRQTFLQMTGLRAEDFEEQLQKCPFATVHRSLRDDLKQLQAQGWLESSAGRYRWVSPQLWPSPPADVSSTLSFAQLSHQQTWEILRVLDSVAFIEPNLAIAVQSLWEQLNDEYGSSYQLNPEPVQRIFIELDYILSEEAQDRVDTYQQQLDSLWQKHEGGVVQFKYWIASEEKQVLIMVYPVCLHYVRRAKYLSAFGFDPDGKWGWHNYRLDRIASNRLKILPWGDPNIPKELKHLWRTGQLPLPTDVKGYLNAAWGFNFYLPRALLIIRFPPKFARWYVDNTERHDTFTRISYQKLPQLIRREINDSTEQKQVLEILKNRPETDVYYQAWIRLGDINVFMRLRDWRPNGEVIAPLVVRQQLHQEALQELLNYQT